MASSLTVIAATASSPAAAASQPVAQPRPLTATINNPVIQQVAAIMRPEGTHSSDKTRTPDSLRKKAEANFARDEKREEAAVNDDTEDSDDSSPGTEQLSNSKRRLDVLA